MNLDPAVSPLLQVLVASAVCAWIAAIGAPLAHAVFAHRPRPVWPFYAPILGLAAVVLTANLAAYAAPGAGSTWFGLLAPSALALVVVVRTRAFPPVSRHSAVALLALALSAAVLFLWVLANYTHMKFGDPHWHLALSHRLAQGGFPPDNPYGVATAIGYHYGADLLTALVVSVAAVPSWTALAVFASFLLVALVLVAAGFAWDVGSPLVLAIGAGAALGVFAGSVSFGLPPYAEVPDDAVGLAGLRAALATEGRGSAFTWLLYPARLLAVALLILVAAAFEAGTTRRQAAVVAGATGLLALAEASVMIFSVSAVGAVAVLRLARLPAGSRFTLVAALVGAALLTALAGGPVSDMLFARGGTSGLAEIGFDLDVSKLVLLEQVRPALFAVGIIPLTAVSGVVAVRRKSWGLALLAATGIFALAEFALIQPSNPTDDLRILSAARAFGLLALLAGLGALVDSWRGWRRIAAVLALLVLVVLPMLVPRAIPGLRLAAEGFRTGRASLDGADYPFVGQSPLHRELIANWDFYQWLAGTLHTDARLLTTHPGAAASIAGAASPTSGRKLQILSPWTTPVYEDAIRFLHRDDLRELEVSHLHVTDALAEALTPQARRLLDDPAHFKLLADRRSVSGVRHRLYEVVPGAGTDAVEPSSYRMLRAVVKPHAPVLLLDGLTDAQRRMLIYTLSDQAELHAQPTYITTVNPRPSNSPVSHIPGPGEDVYVALSERVGPLMLGLSRDDALWAGYGTHVYHLGSAWSRVVRLGTAFSGPDASLRSLCASARGGMQVRLLGEPGDRVTAGSDTVDLSGLPQVLNLNSSDCERLIVAASQSPDHLAPFAQARSRPPGESESVHAAAGLGIDGATQGGMAILNLRYHNPGKLPFAAETEFRLYEVGPNGTTVANLNPHQSIRWWNGPLDLTAESLTARVEFDPRNMQINGDRGLGLSNPILPGATYLLTLNISHGGARSRNIVIQQQLPILRTTVTETDASTEIFSGITSVDFRSAGAAGLTYDRPDDADVHIDFTP